MLHLTQRACSERRFTYDVIIIFREIERNLCQFHQIYKCISNTYFGDGNKPCLGKRTAKKTTARPDIVCILSGRIVEHNLPVLQTSF